MSLSIFKPKSYVGLDIGTDTIKAVQIERSPTGWKIIKTAHVATPEGAIKDGIVVDGPAITDMVKHLVKGGKFTATNAIVGVAGASVIVRAVRVPEMTEAMLRKSIKYEASRYVPSSIEDSFIEFEVIGPAEDGHMDILIVAAPRELVRSRIAAVEEAGLEVDIVDVEAFAMYRSLVEADEATGLTEETIALVDIGSETTQVSVINKGVFTMTRTIPQAGSTLTDALKNHFKLSAEDAVAGKRQLNLHDLVEPTGQENPPLRVLQPYVDELIREIRRSLNYYQSQQTEHGSPNPVTKLVVAGGSAAMPGLGEYMGAKLGLDTNCIGILDNPRFQYLGHDEVGNGIELSVASGLAMRAFVKSA